MHLHFEIRKNLQIGMNRSKFAHDNTCYYSPTTFINSHRTAPADFVKVDIPMKGFAPYGQNIAASDAPKIKQASSGYRIPVYRAGNVPTKTAAKDDAVAKIKAEADARSKAQPNTKPETGDFWSRLKAKIKGGKVVPTPPDKK